jgi:molecular chaperone DnaK
MYLGIDLGTSNSAVVGNIDGTTRLFKTSDGSDVLPSVIYLDKRGHRFVGKSAQDRIMSAPTNVAAGFKRLMGTKSPVKIGDQEWSPEDCSAEIIKTLVGQAITESGEQQIRGAVITIPAAFNQMQSEATISAARMAGLDQVSLLQEPVAAAMASIAYSKQKDGVFLVYDLGGGTFDVALVMSTGGAVNVVAHEGINMLGGRDFDRIVFDSVVRPWLFENFSLPHDFQKDAKYRHLSTIAHRAVEKAKIQLSASETASIFASEDEVRASDQDGEEIYLSIDFTRSELVSLVKDRIEDSIALCRKVISDNGYRHEDISRIVPIGGPSKMPVIREMLQSQLAIEVEQGLDPMTAVAIGAAIFAESRQWEGDKSARKPSRGQETVSGTFLMTVDFKSRIAEDSARVRVSPLTEVPRGFEVEVLDEEGGTTGRKPFDGVVNLNIPVRKDGENRFVVKVYNSAGRVVEDMSREIIIMRTQASAASIPMTYTLAVKTQTGTVGYERNELVPILKKGTALPAEGRHPFRAGKPLKAGEDDYITFEFYEMREGLNDPERNLHIGDFRMNGREELERGERIRRGDALIVHWKMSDNGSLSFAVEVPELGRLIDSHNLYLAPGGHVNFDGQQGSEVATMLLERAESDLTELDETLGGRADASGSLRARIERLDAALSTSVDADTHRSVAEEARMVRQEVALLRLAPENEERVLTKEIDAAEIQFDDLRADAHSVDADRYEKLMATTRRSIRERDFDTARNSLDEMRSIRLKVLSESPEFLLVIFQKVAEEKFLAIDEVLHEHLVVAGIAAVKSNDVSELKGVIGQMFANRVTTGGDATDIVELAHILGS